MVFTLSCIVVGVLLIAMTMGGSFIARLPLSAAMLYLAVGYGIGPAGLGLVTLHPLRDAALLERLTEIAVLISLFTVGFKLELPLSDARWRIPVQLASVSMLITVAAIAALGVLVMDLSLGASVLLGAILAPTDPVLASDVQVANPGDRDRLRFGLTGEGGLNDGTAFPFVMLGLGLLSLHELGAGWWRWWALDVVWAVAGGLAIGYVLGMLVGRSVLYLRTRHREALGADEFIAFGLIALAYGMALLCQTYGFLAVFAAGLALRRIDDRSSPQAIVAQPLDSPAEAPADSATAARHADAPVNMMQAVQRFNSQLERFAEVGIVLTVGTLLAVVEFRRDVLWFVPALFLIIRPLAVYVGLLGTKVTGTARALMGWFGIRGIGSVYYLMYAISHDIEPALAEQLLSIVIAVVVASVVAHGVSVTPLMTWYEKRRSYWRKSAADPP
jgi:NhaP-type Na+/H+ or K+/H+ antiporter